MKKIAKKLSVLSLILLVSVSCSFFKSTSKSESSTAISSINSDSENDAIKAFSEVIEESFEKDEGLFNVYKDDSEYYYEIPDSILDREMLMVSRIARTANGINYGGMKNNTQVLRWQKKDQKILLRRVSFNNTASDTLPVYEAVRNSNFEPILASFDIKAFNEDTTGSVIEVTSLFTEDVPALGLQQYFRQQYQVLRVDGDRTFIEDSRSYPKNIEARHILTYIAQKPPSNADTNTISLEMNHSMILMPEEQMQRRRPDARVGYFTTTQTDYGSKEHRAKPISHITRWKLVPKDKEAYLNGELVEPEQPIVFHIDRATPKEWREYMIKGINDWQVAFEEAGFKNAIYGKMAPTEEEDPDFSLEDVRYPSIRYFASPIQNAFGPHVHDPRSGQIMTSAIGWYHNVMRLLRNWYFVQTAAANPEARNTHYDDEIMGKLIRTVAAHEVGHTLGLPHNFGSSYAFPVDSLRSPTFTDSHGTAPSIMDYARFNYIAQPGDGITDFLPKIGEYDKWAVKWGYTWFGDKTLEEQEKILHQWTKERAGNPIYFYGQQTANSVDPRANNEDLGNDAMKASTYGIQNLKVINKNLIEWVREEGKDFSELEEIYNELLDQWEQYMDHVAPYIGGVYENNKTFDQEGVVFTPVEAERQREAMAFLVEHAFSEPTWQINKDILGKINRADFIESFRERQDEVLKNVLNAYRLARLIEYEHRSEDAYSPFEFMDDLRSSIWSELESGSPISVYRRNLQRAYIERMEELMTEELPQVSDQFREYFGWTKINVNQSDIHPIVREQLDIVMADAENLSNRINDRATQIHLNDVVQRIEIILDPNS